MREKLWVITVTREDGWGPSWQYFYHDGDKAMDKFHKLVKEYDLDLVGFLCNAAVKTTATLRHIDEITIEPKLFSD